MINRLARPTTVERSPSNETQKKKKKKPKKVFKFNRERGVEQERKHIQKLLDARLKKQAHEMEESRLFKRRDAE